MRHCIAVHVRWFLFAKSLFPYLATNGGRWLPALQRKKNSGWTHGRRPVSCKSGTEFSRPSVVSRAPGGREGRRKERGLLASRAFFGRPPLVPGNHGKSTRPGSGRSGAFCLMLRGILPLFGRNFLSFYCREMLAWTARDGRYWWQLFSAAETPANRRGRPHGRWIGRMRTARHDTRWPGPIGETARFPRRAAGSQRGCQWPAGGGRSRNPAHAGGWFFSRARGRARPRCLGGCLLCAGRAGHCGVFLKPPGAPRSVGTALTKKNTRPAHVR